MVVLLYLILFDAIFQYVADEKVYICTNDRVNSI